MTRTLLSDRQRSTLFLADDPAGGRVVLKVLKAEYPSSRELLGLHNEVELTRSLGIAGVRRGLRKERVSGRHAVVLEYVEGRSLEKWAGELRGDLSAFFRVAIPVAGALGQLHEARVIHRDIKPGNIVFDPGSGSIKIIDFSLASRIDRKSARPGSPEQLEGTLLYLSPEQTGRMNRQVDYRTDLYSLGASLFELLTGRPPFDAADPLELVHCHIARVPPAPRALDPRVPEALSDMVLRLLAKSADDRYQSAFGLQHDLERCRDQLAETGVVTGFALGAYDASGRLQIPERLHGREREVAALERAFERAAGGGRELVLVAGYSGVGKSALVRELQRPVSEGSGYFIEGKFDPLNRSAPYAAIARALGDLVSALLTEGDARLLYFRERIESATGTLGRVLTDLLPDLELIVGPQPALLALKGEGAQNRLHYVLGRFVRAVAGPGHPLALFLDDLQWADGASLLAIEAMLEGAEGARLLVIGAYRDNEVTPTSPLPGFLGRLRVSGVPTEPLTLEPLTSADVGALIAGALRQEPASILGLERAIFQKTKGNAFFVRQLLMALSEQGALEFDRASRRWRWDPARIAALQITDNVIDLLAGKMRALPPGAQRALTLASCVGGRFDLGTLSVLCERPAPDALADLWPAIEAGLVVPAGEGIGDGSGGVFGPTEYAFAHDRVQQAAYSLLPHKERAAAHLRAGRRLLATSGEAERGARVFDITLQMNLGAALIDATGERRALARLNLEAGERAMRASAYPLALGRLASGAALLGPEGLATDRALLLELESGAAVAAYLSGDHAAAERAAEAALQYARDPFESLRAHDTLVLVAVARRELDVALAVGQRALAGLGVVFPAAPGMAHVAAALVRTKLALAGRRTESLLELPLMTDRSKMAAMHVMERLIPAAFRSGSKLFPLLVFRLVNLSLQHGNMPVSAFAYASYAIMLSGVLGDYEAGYRFGKLSIALLEKLGAEAFRARVLFVFNNFIRPWKEPLDSSSDGLELACQSGLETGSLFEAIWSAYYRVRWNFAAGRDLEQVARSLDDHAPLLRRDEGAESLSAMLRQVLENLRDEEAPDPARLKGAHFDEDAVQRRYATLADKTEIAAFHLCKAQLAVLFRDLPAARLHAEKAEVHLEAVLGLPYVPLIHFYASLARLGTARDAPDRRALMRKVGKSMSFLRTAARHSPRNFEHKLRLLEAELARVQGDGRGARELYDAAVSSARSSGLLSEEALALELAGEFYVEIEQPALAQGLLRNAYLAYRQWGAHAKAAALAARHAGLGLVPAGPARPGDSASARVTSSTTGQQSLDLASLMKASAAISSELVMERLLGRLIRIVVENAGADRGALLLFRGGGLRVEAEVELSSGRTEVMRSIPLADASSVCDAAVRYVERTQEMLLLRDALADPQFGKTARVRAAQVRSLLCAPLRHQGRLTGVLYLENNLTPDAFTPERLAVLEMLSSQVSIAIDNATLYESLEGHRRQLEVKVEARTQELRARNTELADSLDHLAAELADAAAYVRSLLPPKLTAPLGVDWRFVPSAQLGGDAFGYHFLEDGRLAVYLLDVCGHGIASTLLSIAALTSLQSERLPGADFGAPATVLDALNRAFPMGRHNGLYFTIWYGVIDARARRLRYASAGHPPPLIVSPGAQVAAELESGGVMIGVTADAVFTTHDRSLDPSSRLFVFSDGAYEISRPDGAMLQFDDFAAELSRAAPNARDKLDAMIAFARATRGGAALEDDFSLLALDIP